MTRAQANSIDYSISAMRKWEKLPEDVRAEVIDGRLYILTVPTPYHSKAITSIVIQLGRYVLENKLGDFYCSSVGIFLAEGKNVVIPDLVFVSKNNSAIIDKKGVHGAPDLVIEVLSPSTSKRDITLKKSLYEKTGVREYWIVDPDTKDTWGYILENNSYNEPLKLNSKLHVRILNKKIKF